MVNVLKSILLDKLVANPLNPNRMGKAQFNKLVRNIERSGRYEPMVVRAHPKKKGFFEIINGHHRCGALRKLGFEKADCVVWDVDDEQVQVLLLSLNRLCGSDDLGKRLKLLERLKKRFGSGELGKILPEDSKQIERLTSLKLPVVPLKAEAEHFLSGLVFFVSDSQKQQIEKALAAAEVKESGATKAARRSGALFEIAKYFLSA